jgi:histidyl-tRNA synthetase
MEGLSRLRELFACTLVAGIPADLVVLDLSIARGLDYYTGTIYETYLGALPQIGSVCSGGRYDNLAGLFTRQPLPGVGASLGLDRLLAAMDELGLVATASTPAPVLITFFDESRLGDYLRIGRALRAGGIATEVFPQCRPLGKQLQYADRKGFRAALIAGAQEFEAGVWQVKDLHKQLQQAVPELRLVSALQSLLAS